MTDSTYMTDSMNRMGRAECLARLAAGTVGRVAATSHALPVIVPVNYTLYDDAVIFRTTGDGLLARACDSTVVAFEVDEVAADGSGGWSVLAVGLAQLLDGSQTLRAVEQSLVSAVGDGRDHFIRIELGRVSGRRIGTDAVADRFAVGTGTGLSDAS